MVNSILALDCLFYLCKQPKPTMRLAINILLFCCFSVMLSGQDGETTVDSLQTVLEKHPSQNENRVDVLNDLGYRYWIVDSNESVKYGSEALQLAEKLDYTEGTAMSKRVLGVAYWTLGQLKLALENLTTAQSIYENIGDNEGAANCLMNTGMVYADIGDYDKAIAIYDHSIEKFTKLDLKSRIATTFTKIGTALLKKDHLYDAKEYLTNALNMHSEDNFTYGMAEAHHWLGTLSILEGELEQADHHLRRAIILGKKVNDKDGLIGNLIQYGKLLRLEQNYEAAEAHLNLALERADTKHLQKYKLEALGELRNLKKEEGKLNESLQYYDSYTALNDSIYDVDKSRQIAAMEFAGELENKEREILLLREKERTNTIIKWGFVGGILALGTIFFLVYKNQRQKRAKKREMYQRKQELMASKEELAETELENARLKQQEMAQQLQFRNRELTSYTLNFVQKNELLQQLQEKIAIAKEATPSAQSKLLTELHHDIKQHVNIDRDWEDFKRYFEEVHTGFHSTLKQKHPDLSPNDLKISSLTRLNLNIKETASILGISPESAKTARYRLRKKLNLSPDQELLDYFLELEQ